MLGKTSMMAVVNALVVKLFQMHGQMRDCRPSAQQRMFWPSHLMHPPLAHIRLRLKNCNLRRPPWFRLRLGATSTQKPAQPCWSCLSATSQLFCCAFVSCNLESEQSMGMRSSGEFAGGVPGGDGGLHAGRLPVDSDTSAAPGRQPPRCRWRPRQNAVPPHAE